MASFLDVCRFLPTAGGTTDWTVSSAVTGYQTPLAAGAINGAVYRYRAESGDQAQWEVGYGAYNSGTPFLARTTVLFNSLGTTAKVNFSSIPQVAIVALAEDLTAIADVSWTAYTPTITSQNGTFTGASITATGRYVQMGKTVTVEADVLLTTLGSGSPTLGLRVSLPFTAAAFNYTGSSREILLTGKSGGAFVAANGTFLDARDATGTSYIAAGTQVICSVTYEVP